MSRKVFFQTSGWAAAAVAAGILGICSISARAQTNYGYYDPGESAQPPAAKPAPAKKPAAPAAAPAPSSQAEACFSTQQSSVGGAVQETTCTETMDGRQLATRNTQMTTSGGGPGSKYQEQDETVQVDPETTRTTKKLLAPDADGNMKPIQVITEETRKLSGGQESVVRTVSRPDQNGQLQVEQKELTETAPKGSNEQEMHTTVLMPGSAGQLEPVIKTDQVQQKNGKEVETHTTQMLPDGNGGWTASLVQQSVTKPGENGGSTEEQKVFQVGPEGQLRLTQRKLTREWTGENGEQKSVVETYSGNYPGTNEYQQGQLGLVERVSTTRTVGKDGTQEIQQKTETANLLAPWEGLRVTGQVNETSQPAGDGRVETKREVLGPDSDGRMTQISVFTGEAPAQQTAAPPEEKKAQPAGKQGEKGGSEAAGGGQP